MKTTLTTETALITGASSGIGRELAILCAKNGLNVVLVSRNKVALEALSNKIMNDYSVKAFVLDKDLAHPNAGFEIKELLDQNQIAIDVLVNNAGFGICEPFANVPVEVSSEMILVNMYALTMLTRLLLPPMLQRGYGKIVNIASVAAFISLPFMATYAASKAYVLSFSKALAEEVYDSGIQVVVVCPGPTETLFYERAKVSTSEPLQKLPHMTAAEVASITFKAMMSNKQVVVITGLKNKIAVVMLSILSKIFGMRLIRFGMKAIVKANSDAMAIS